MIFLVQSSKSNSQVNKFKLKPVQKFNQIRGYYLVTTQFEVMYEDRFRGMEFVRVLPVWKTWKHDARDSGKYRWKSGGSSIDAFTSDYPNCGLRIGRLADGVVGHSRIGGYQFIRIVRYPKHG